MATGIGNLGNIVSDFTSTLKGILGLGGSDVQKGGTKLFKPEYGGSMTLDQDKWIGNAGADKVKVRYGFVMMDLTRIKKLANSPKRLKASEKDKGFGTPYFLDIPPKSIIQKEKFATNIQATRKGIIVESEGVVFKDIIIQGTTGVFPGERSEAGNAIPNFTNFGKPPGASGGVESDTGRSRKTNVKTISGYEEFLRLRQYFLKYAAEKVNSDGNLFLVFINEKDNQTLIVEPREFEMDRNSRSPMTYDYKITLTAIGSLNAVFRQEEDDDLNFFEAIGNIAANITATVATGRALMNENFRLLKRISAAVDTTVNGPLRQVQLATKDLTNGVVSTLALPEVLSRNVTDTKLSIAEAWQSDDFQSKFAQGLVLEPRGRTEGDTSKVIEFTSEGRAESASELTTVRDVVNSIENDSKVTIPRSFVEDRKAEMQELADSLSDFVGLGSPEYDALKGRISTIIPDPLKEVSDDEFLLMGAIAETSNVMNEGLATNVLYEADADAIFNQTEAVFANENIAEDRQIKITKPKTVREITIERGDTLERIAQREYDDATRWLDLVVLNRLKPPYLDDNPAEGVKQFGEKLLIGID